MVQWRKRIKTFFLLGLIGIMGIPAMAKSWIIEAETAATQSQSSSDWQIQKESGASGGAILIVGAQDALTESSGIKVLFPAAGRYWIWVRYQRSADNNYGSFYAVVRDASGEALTMKKLDWFPRLPTERPYQSYEAASRKGTKTGDFIWEHFPVTAERAMKSTLHFGGIAHGGKTALRRIDCAIVTDDANFNPTKNSWKNLAAFSTQETLKIQPPVGMHPAAGFPMNSAFFAGITDPARQFKMGLGYNAAVYPDNARFIELGFNRTHGATRASQQYGIYAMGSANVYANMDAAEAKKYPSPEGRFVNAAGEVGKSWSFFFPPLQDSLLERTKKIIAPFANDSPVEDWRIVAESGGFTDYSNPAKQSFRQWLQNKYKDIDHLNQLWSTSYKSFDDVQPPKDVLGNFAAWFAFRQFNGEEFAETIQRQAQAIRQADPLYRPLTEQLSNLDLLSPKFKTLRPMDWEQFINIALKDVKNIGWDGYAADDYMGAEIDLVRSFAKGKTLLNEEWNTHAADPRITARTFWTMIGKGLQGVHLFQWQEGTFHESYPKWALLNHDFTPKSKLGAMADAAQEVHRLERLLMPAKPVDVVKPVALYYSEIDLSLSQPLASAWGEPVDTPYHVYATLRGMGYPVRWITPTQIENGELKNVSAMVLINAQHIPQTAARTLAEWIHQGGAAIADRWPGAFDEYGRPQNELSQVFGVRAKPAKNKTSNSQLAMQESSQGYGEVTINALNEADLPGTVGEIWQQWDATNPVAKQMGNYTLAGYGLMKVQCTAGQVIAMTFGGDPGITINSYGKGHAMYVAMMLGSLYESSATRYEWDTAHSGTAYSRLLDNFLRYAGAQPSAIIADLPLRLRAKLRVENPLIDSKGNALFALTSFNDVPLNAFNLQLQWPSKLAPPKVLLIATGGNRRLQKVPFKMANGKLILQMIPFDTHATILTLANSDPLVGLNVTGVNRGPARLLMVQPSDTLKLTATVYNPSPAPIPAGQVQLWAPEGWFMDAAQKHCPAIKPWESVTVKFEVRAPAMGGATRLRPIVVKHIANGKTSTPATEEVWWNRSEKSTF